MKLLFITASPPDRPDRDGMTQIAHALIRELGQAHHIDVWTLVDSANEETVHVPGASQVLLFPRRHTNLALYYLRGARQPYFQARYESTQLHHTLRHVAAGAYDLVIFHSPFVAHYIRDVRIPSVIHVLDALSDWFPKTAQQEKNPLKRAHLNREGRLARRMEKNVLPLAKALVVVGGEDAATIRTAAPHTVIETIPIGIDEHVFHPTTTPRAPATVIMTGIMDYPPNVDAAEFYAQEVWPEVLRTIPTAQLRIVGKNPDQRVQALGAQPNITVTGRVPSVAAELQHATVAVTPLRFGTGYKIKVNEALACGTPLITSPASIVGTGVIVGTDCLVATTTDEWITHTTSLLTNHTDRQRLSEHAIVFAAHRAWPAIAQQYLELYERCIA